MVCAKNPLTADVSCGERHQYQSGESKTLKGFDLSYSKNPSSLLQWEQFAGTVY